MKKASDENLESFPEPEIGMEHPHYAAVFQAQMDAEILRAGGVAFEEAIPRTIERMKELFGTDVPVRRIEQAIRQVWNRPLTNR